MGHALYVRPRRTTRRLARSFGRAAAALAVAAFWGSPGQARAALAEYRGVNDFGAYGFDTQSFRTSPGGTMKNWGVNIVRQVVPEFDTIPFGTTSIPDPVGPGRIYGLQGIVNDVKANVGPSAVTVLCPFTWQSQEVLAKVPSATPYFSAYKSRLSGMAKQFAGQSNVWLEVWNEPYTTNSPGTWLSDMKSMVDSLRAGTGFTGKIVIPGGNYSGHEAPILSQGKTLVDYDPQHNIVFDLHAYSNFIENQSAAAIGDRIQRVLDTGVDFMFGEFGPAILGKTTVEDVSPFLAAVQQKHVTALAWNWNDKDINTLHNSDGSLNNTAANANWADQVLAYTRSAPAVPEPTGVVALGAIASGLLRRRRAV